jgi:ABC-type lipoprotein export system ATPase subunit
VTALIETRDLRRIYEGHVRALDGVSLRITAGEMMAVMGPSGSGKSTLLHLLGALDRPTSGRIVFEGQDLAEIADIDRFRGERVGFVFQSHNLIPTLSALENVLVAMRGGAVPPRGREAWALSLLERVGLGGLAMRRPAQLSGGQRQRVALARALANRPSLVLADEPTGNLDSQNGADVLRLLRESNATLGTTVVMVTHDPVVALENDRILTLRDGRIELDEPVETVYRAEVQALRATRVGRLLFGAAAGAA